MNKKKLLVRVWIIVGIALSAVPLFYLAKEKQNTEYLLHEFEAELGELEEEKSEESKKGGDSKQAASGETDETILEKEKVIGIIEIKSIGIKYPIVEGTGVTELRYAIGHISETACIGEEGNCVLAGHNGSRYGRFFTELNEIVVGDKVELTDKTGNIHEYEVDDTYIVGPYDTEVKAQTGEKLLTLLTCSNRGTKRFICRCVPVKEREE